jgi:hypothetical protein
MSFVECTQALQGGGLIRINAGDFSMDEIEDAARTARESHATLVLYNMKGRSGQDIARIHDAGGNRVVLDDFRLI